LHNGVELRFKLLLLSGKLIGISIRVAFKELKSFVHDVVDGSLVFIGELIAHLLVAECVLELETVVLESILSLNLLAKLLIFVFESLCFLNHLLDVFCAEAACLVLDLDLFGAAIGFVDSLNVQDSVGVNVE